MRKLIKLVLMLVVVLIVAAIALPFLLPVDTYKQEIAARVKSMTGRELVIAGSMHASLFPTIGIEIEKASLSNPEGFSGKQMLYAEKLVLEVELMPLFTKQVRVKRFVLDKPVIQLEVNADGKPNWEFSSPEAPAASAQAAATDNKKSDTLLAGFMLGEVKISDGNLSYRDAQKKTSYTFSEVNLKAGLPSLQDSFSMSGDAIWNNEKTSLVIALENPAQFISGTPTSFSVDLRSSLVNLHYLGKATQKNAAGAVKLEIPSLPKLAKWTGSPFNWKGSAALAFAVSGNLDCSESACALKDGDIVLDAIRAKGNMKASFDGKPNIEATLAMETIDLNPYLPKKQANVSWFIAPAFAAEPWSSEPIDLSGLRVADATLHLSTGSLLYDKIKLGKASLELTLKDGVLRTVVPEAAFYGGSVKSDATLAADGTFTKQATLTNVDSEPFLHDALGEDRFSGKLNAAGNFSGTLTSMRGMVESLGGSGNIKITDGAVKGVDLAGMIRNVQSAFRTVDTAAQKTDFSELSGTFTIAKGIVGNNDLAMKAPLLRLSGKGTLDLPQQTINYRLTPEIVQTIQGQGGKDKQGLQVPILISGPMDAPNFVPDIAGMAQQVIDNPQAVKDVVKDVKVQIKENKGAIKDLLKELKAH